MSKFKRLINEWMLVVVAFGCLGSLFFVRPATWLSTVLIVLASLIVVFDAELKNRFVRLFQDERLKLIAWPFVIWFGVALLISIVHSVDQRFHGPSNELRFFLSLSILCFLPHKKTKCAFHIGLIVSACAAAVWGWYEVWWVGEWRAQGTTNNPIHFGNLTALVALLCFSVALMDKTLVIVLRIALLLSASMAVFASFTSLTRSSVIIILCAVPLIWSPRKDLFHKLFVKVASIFLVAIICLIGFSTQVQERLRIHELTAAFNSPDQIDYERLTSNRANMWYAAVLMFEENPLIGVGPRGFAQTFQKLADQGLVKTTAFHNQPHNDILYSASMGGVLKLLAYCCLIGGPFFYFWQSYQARNNLTSAISAILGMQVVGAYFLTGLTNSNFDLQIYSTTYACLLYTSDAADD